MTLHAWIVWDLIALFILLAFVRSSACKGFVRTVMSFFGYFIAAAVSNALSPALAKWLYENIVRDVLRLTLQSRLDRLLVQGADLSASIADLLPAALRGIAPGADSLSGINGLGSEVLIQEMLSSLLEEPVISILRAILFFAAFGMSLFIVRRVVRLFTALHRVPVLGTLDIFLGGVAGALEGVIFLYLLAVALRLAILLTGDTLPWLNEALLDDTYILRVFLQWGTV